MSDIPMVSAAQEVLNLLAQSKNVLISGPPGTGKTRLLAEVATMFAAGGLADGVAMLDHDAEVAIRDADETRVFRTVFHQSSKYRDFVTGMAPAIGAAHPGTFVIIEGTLYRASEHAAQPGCASLLIIDEINRGPAVQVFGGSLAAIEADKRLLPDGNPSDQTQYFEIMSAPDGIIVEYALPDRLYLVAVQNQADVSVEPMDVAFLRRFEPYRLEPNEAVLRAHYGLDAAVSTLPDEAHSPSELYEASVQAWRVVNERLSIGRGPDFQIGHGLLMLGDPAGADYAQALALVARGWARALAHIGEVFFGDTRSIAVTLNAMDNPPNFHPLELIEQAFGGELRYELRGQNLWLRERLYDGLRAVASTS